MLKYQRNKLRRGRQLSIIIPIAAAVVLSFGNDFISWRIFEDKDMVHVGEVKNMMFVSNVFLVVGLFLTILFSNIIFRQIIRRELVEPLGRLTEGMTQMQKGNLDYQITYDEDDTLYEVYETFNEMVIETRRLSVQSREIGESRRELLLSISHDLRSPLTSIIGYVQGLIDQVPKTENAREIYLRTIKQKALDINRMVERLFLFSKLDYDKYEGSPEKLSVNAELWGLVSAYQHDYKEQYEIELFVEGQGFIFADREIFAGICRNIIENSYKYNDNPQGKLRITVKEESGYVRIRFSDNGPGMREEDLPHMWDVFYRADQARNNPCQGSGIGLAIVKKAVDNLRGKITSKNGIPRGLVTTVRIPKVPSEKEN